MEKEEPSSNLHMAPFSVYLSIYLWLICPAVFVVIDVVPFVAPSPTPSPTPSAPHPLSHFPTLPLTVLFAVNVC